MAESPSLQNTFQPIAGLFSYTRVYPFTLTASHSHPHTLTFPYPHPHSHTHTFTHIPTPSHPPSLFFPSSPPYFCLFSLLPLLSFLFPFLFLSPFTSPLPLPSPQPHCNNAKSTGLPGGGGSHADGGSPHAEAPGHLCHIFPPRGCHAPDEDPQRCPPQNASHAQTGNCHTPYHTFFHHLYNCC